AGSGHGVAFLHKGPQAEAWRTIAAVPSAGASRIRFDGLARGLSALPGTPTAEGTIAAKAGRAQPRRLRITAGTDCCRTEAPCGAGTFPRSRPEGRERGAVSRVGKGDRRPPVSGAAGSGPFDVFQRRGRDHHCLPLADEGRHRDAHAVVEDGRLVAVGGGLALHYRLALDAGTGHLLRQFDRKRLALVLCRRRRHPVLQERTAVAEDVGRDLDLFEGLGVHEDQHAVLLVEELLVLLVEAHPLDLVGGAETLVEL